MVPLPLESNKKSQRLSPLELMAETHVCIPSDLNQCYFNPIALRKAKIVCNFGLPECNRVNYPRLLTNCFHCLLGCPKLKGGGEVANNASPPQKESVAPG